MKHLGIMAPCRPTLAYANEYRHVLKDEEIELRGFKTIEGYSYPLRRIEV